MKAFFVPSVFEGEKIFSGIKFNRHSYDILCGDYRGTPVFTTGVSKVPAVFNSIIAIKDFNITEAVLTGVCGAYRSSGLSVGDLVSIKREHFADEGLYTEGSFKTLDEMGFGFIKNRYIEYSVFENLPAVESATVSFLDGVGEISELFAGNTGAQVENMEGAAFGYVCNMLSVKCYQVRSVSNFCGERSSQQWDIKKALSNLKNYFDLLSL